MNPAEDIILHLFLDWAPISLQMRKHHNPYQPFPSLHYSCIGISKPMVFRIAAPFLQTETLRMSCTSFIPLFQRCILTCLQSLGTLESLLDFTHRTAFDCTAWVHTEQTAPLVDLDLLSRRCRCNIAKSSITTIWNNIIKTQSCCEEIKLNGLLGGSVDGSNQ